MTRPALSAPRVDIYAAIHKALRAMMADTLLAAGNADVADLGSLHALCERVRALSVACGSHLRHENEYVHPAMEMRSPGSSAHAAAEHKQQRAAIVDLHETAIRLSTEAADGKPQIVQDLYRKLSIFMAENLEHMLAEEVEHNPVLWACYSDAELTALHGRIVASISPAETLATMRWMIPALAPHERAQLLIAMRAQAPAPAFAAVLDAVRPHLDAKDWAKLESALGPEAMAA